MKLGAQDTQEPRTKINKKLPPPKRMAGQKQKKENDIMAKNTGTAQAVETENETEDDQKLPRHMRFALQLRRGAQSMGDRTAKKGQLKKMRAWIDSAADVVDDASKGILTDVGKCLDAASKAMVAAADLLDQLPDNVALRRGREGESPLQVGAEVSIVEKHAPKYADLFGTTKNLKIIAFRKAHAVIEYADPKDTSGAKMRCVLPKNILAAE